MAIDEDGAGPAKTASREAADGARPALPPIHQEFVRGIPMPVFADRDRSLVDILQRSVQYGDRPYLECDGVSISFAQHHRLVTALARAFTEQYGIKPGDRVALLSANSIEWVLTFWASVSLGAIVVAMNAHWAPEEAAEAIDGVAPAVIVADARRRARLAGSGYTSTAPILVAESDLSALLATPEGSSSPSSAVSASTACLPECDIDEDDPAVIVYTSGTTGRPKGAVHSHRNVIAASDYFRYNDARAGIGPVPPGERRYLMTGPLFHISALHNLVVPRLATGETVVMYTGRFDVDRVLALIEAQRVTHWTAVPTMAYRLLQDGNSGGRDLSCLQSFSLASAPTSAEMRAALRRLLPKAAARTVATYGQTECTTAATMATADDLARDPLTVGRPVVNLDLQIRDEHGHELQEGTEGEVCVRGPQVMLGYWNNPEATAAAIGEDGWLRTGDIGIARDGQVRILSRRKDLIIRGGENIYPVEVEDALAEHPEVVESIVVGRPSEEFGEEVAAVVVVSEADRVTAEELRAHLADRVAPYKTPTEWDFTTTRLQRNTTGKVLRALYYR